MLLGEKLRHEWPIKRLRRLQDDIRIGDIPCKNAFRQHQQIRASVLCLSDQFDADVGVFLPDLTDSKLSKGDLHAGTPTRPVLE